MEDGATGRATGPEDDEGRQPTFADLAGILQAASPGDLTEPGSGMPGASIQGTAAPVWSFFQLEVQVRSSPALEPPLTVLEP